MNAHYYLRSVNIYSDYISADFGRPNIGNHGSIWLEGNVFGTSLNNDMSFSLLALI